jgi:enediyne biosynthesis protein E4
MEMMMKLAHNILLTSSFAAMTFGLVALAQNTTPVIPKFLEETQSSGLSSRYEGDYEFMVGGGVATFDCNGDDLPEVFLSGGTNKSVLYENASEIGGALKFNAFQSGLELENVTGAYPLDVNSDGITDLMVLRVGENILFRGLGHCQFERANEQWNFKGGDEWSTSFAATWEKGSSLPTLAVGNYIDRNEIEPWGHCSDNQLFRPARDAAGYAAPLALKPSYCALSMLFSDWNRSGRASLRIANDREYYKGGQEQLWKITPGLKPRRFTEVEGWKPLKIWGMGIASYDVTGDGYPDYFMTSMADSKLQTLSSGAKTPTYGDIAFKRGVIAQRPYTGDDVHPSTGWHAQFDDVNNDGLIDLFIAKGNVAKMPDFAMRDPNNLLLGKPDGSFLEAGLEAGVVSMERGRGGSVIDLNRDGQLDLIVVNRWAPAQVWRNTSTNLGHWLQIKLSQDRENRNAIGARLEVKVGKKIVRREITIGGGHASGNLGWIHVGLGEANNARVRICWPDGKTGPWETLEADKFYLLERGQAAGEQ